MTEESKTVMDVAAGGVTVTALMDIVPEATALLSLAWVCIRIWETETIRKLTGRE
jgi:tetrahydromethanopterin S-methyltransferase subunit C